MRKGIWWLACFSVVLFESCDSIYNTICCECSEKDLALFNAVEEGNLDALRSYLENDGDPVYKCFYGPGRGFGMWRYLHSAISANSSVELVRYYLSYPLQENLKDEMLEQFVGREDADLTQLLVEEGAHVSNVASNCLERFWEQKEYEVLAKAGYNFNWQDDDGNTLLMLHAKCFADSTSDELITIVQFLIDNGARTDLKNNDDKTAYDLAVNPKVKEFLAQYE